MKQEATNPESKKAGKFKLYATAAFSALIGAALGYVAGSIRSHITIDIHGESPSKELKG